jgi:excisionase family DNA binding protein
MFCKAQASLEEAMPSRKGRKNRDESGLNLSPMLTTGEACRMLCVHSNTLRRWSEQGVIVAYRIGPRGDRRFKREDVLALLVEANKNNSNGFIN